MRPSFIVVIDDDLNTRSLVELPDLVGLVGESGTDFHCAFATTPLCGPSRVSFLTGRYAHNHGITDNLSAASKFSAAGDSDCLPVWLHRAGYRTGLIGKYLTNYQDAAYIPPGWTSWYSVLGRFEEMRVSDNGTETLCPGHTAITYGERAESFLTGTPPTQPFFLWIGVNAPHDPPEVEPRYEAEFASAVLPRPPSFNAFGRNEVDWLAAKPPLTPEQIAAAEVNHRDRLRAMLSVRDLLARLIASLQAIGRLDSTYIVLTSDHGYHQGQHRMLPGKMTPFDEDIRIPMMVRGPNVTAGQVRTELVANIDLAPTIAELARAARPAWVDGRSFAALLGAEPVVWGRRQVGIEAWGTRSRNPVIPGAPDYFGLRSELYRFVEYATGETEWYRLDLDPHELKNKPRAANPDNFDSLRRTAARIRACSGEECRLAEDVPSSSPGSA
jgi:arylsulfatase A-like enzyme